MKDAAKRDAFNLWLACHTQDEIAEAVGWPRQSIDRWLGGIAQNGKNTEMGNTHDSDEDESDSPFALSKPELAAADHATGRGTAARYRQEDSSCTRPGVMGWGAVLPRPTDMDTASRTDPPRQSGA